MANVPVVDDDIVFVEETAFDTDAAKDFFASGGLDDDVKSLFKQFPCVTSLPGSAAHIDRWQRLKRQFFHGLRNPCKATGERDMYQAFECAARLIGKVHTAAEVAIYDQKEQTEKLRVESLYAKHLVASKEAEASTLRVACDAACNEVTRLQNEVSALKATIVEMQLTAQAPQPIPQDPQPLVQPVVQPLVQPLVQPVVQPVEPIVKPFGKKSQARKRFERKLRVLAKFNAIMDA